MRILLVEDNPEVSEFVVKALRSDGYAVDQAIDGKSGLDMALGESYDGVILDVALPGMDGLDIVREMRKVAIMTPVLMLTARTSVSDRVVGLDAGADDYLGKPFALSELRARVRALLRRGETAQPPALRSGPLVLDTGAHEVTIHGQIVSLTSKEFSILEYLLRNRNRVCSKGMIADHVWDYHFDSDYNLIEVYMRRLRNKLAPHLKDKLIQTVRNSGYVIRTPEA